MMIWLLCTLLTLLAVALLLLPLFRRSQALAGRVDYDMVIYRDQLAEVERDRERGLIDTTQVEAVRNEILRRMLAAEDIEEESLIPLENRMGRQARLSVIAVILIALPVAALILYLLLGSPGLPAQPMAERLKDPDYALTVLAEDLSKKLETYPNPQDFKRLAATYSSLHRYDLAVGAYRSALQGNDAEPEGWSDLGEAIVLANDGIVTTEAVQAFARTLSLQPKGQRARFYLGLAAAQAEDLRRAVGIWRDLEKDGPEDAPWMPMLREHIASYSHEGGFEAKDIPPLDPQATQEEEAPGPSAEGQEQFIRAMVARLAGELERAPNNPEGWQKLGRAYRVLGQTEQAKQALKRAIALRPEDIAIKLSLAEIELGEIKDGPFTDDFVQIMRDILALDSTNVDALYYVGEAEHRANHDDETRRLWRKAIGQLPDDSKERGDIQRRLDALGS